MAKVIQSSTPVGRDASAKASPWGIKEVITTVLLSVLIIVLQLAVASLSVFSIDFSMVASTALACFVAAPVFMLMTMRVRKFGTTIILAALTSLAFCAMGNYWYMVPFYLAGGLVVDLMLLKQEWRIDPNRVCLAWTVYSAMYVASSLLPIAINVNAYVEEATTVRMLDQSYIDAYLFYFGQVEWIVGIVALTALGGFLGSLLGKRMTRKHFEKAGVL